jgi:hypothetical protein
VIDEMGGLDIPLGTIDSENAAKQAWELVDRVEPQVLVLDTTTAERFLALAPPSPRPWLLGAIWLRTDSSPAPPVLPDQVGFTGWQGTWLGIAEVRSFAAAGCAAGVLHMDSEVYGEAVGSPASGEIGRLTLTPLSGDSVLLRYETQLQCRRLTAPCACGRLGPSFEVP